VPDSITAKKIAEAVWLPLYGKEVLNQRPYSAKLIEDSIWIVTGNFSRLVFKHQNKKCVPPSAFCKNKIVVG
jgi:hypothetical protein